jgi:hypothetical protein
MFHYAFGAIAALQPVGLVVSPPALIKAQAVIDRAKLVDLQERLQGVVSTEAIPRHGDERIAWIENFPAFTQKVLDWMPEDLVAQRCLYGVDKNSFAVNLAKLSLWLVTLAKDQPFTFVDHALKCGDSLVGLTRAEIGSFGKDTTEDLPLFKYLKEKVDRAKAYRTQIQALDTRTDADAEEKLAQWQRAERELEEAKLIGDVRIAAFFAGKSKKDREAKLSEYADLVRTWRQSVYTQGDPTTPPPHHPTTTPTQYRSVAPVWVSQPQVCQLTQAKPFSPGNFPIIKALGSLFQPVACQTSCTRLVIPITTLTPSSPCSSSTG